MPSTDAEFMRKNRVLRVTLAVALVLLAGAAPAQEVTSVDKPPLAKGWQLETVATGVPQGWGMAWLPDGRMLVTGKGGTLHML
ncbi:MAG: PQQ-dependent sugar dehydrogenase, partial [Oxalobacteraceae bacterium]